MKMFMFFTLHMVPAMAGRITVGMEEHIATDGMSDAEVEAAAITAMEGMSNSYASVSSETASFENATGFAKSGLWVNESTRVGCQVTATSWQWFGTGPFCDTSADDCYDHGMQFERFGAHGSSCWSGKKVLCSKRKTTKHDDCNIFCNPGVFRYSMYGTAPFCEGDSCDCWRQGDIPIRADGQWSCPCSDQGRCPDELQRQGNSRCFTGRKQFCVAPIGTTGNMDMNQVKSCDFRFAEAQKTKRAAMKMVADVAESGAKAAVAIAAR